MKWFTFFGLLTAFVSFQTHGSTVGLRQSVTSPVPNAIAEKRSDNRSQGLGTYESPERFDARNQASATFDSTQIYALMPGTVHQIKAFDLDRDGVDEMLVIGSGNGVHGMSITILKYDAMTQRYAMHKQKIFPHLAPKDFHLNLVARDSLGKPFAIISNLVAQRIDLLTLEVVNINYAASFEKRDFLQSDLNGDGQPEYYSIEGSQIRTIDIDSLFEGQSYAFDGMVIGAGRFSGGLGIEILTYGFSSVQNTNQLMLWNVQNGLPVKVRAITYEMDQKLTILGDVNGDDHDDLIYLRQHANDVIAFDINASDTLWSTTLPNEAIEELQLTSNLRVKNRIYARQTNAVQVLAASTGVVEAMLPIEGAPAKYRAAITYGLTNNQEQFVRVTDHAPYGIRVTLVAADTWFSRNAVNGVGDSVVLNTWVDLDSDGVDELVSLTQGQNWGEIMFPQILVFNGQPLSLYQKVSIPSSTVPTKSLVLDAVHVPGIGEPGKIWMLVRQENGVFLRRVDLKTFNAENVDLNLSSASNYALHAFENGVSGWAVAVLSDTRLTLFDGLSASVIDSISLPYLHYFSGVHLSNKRHLDGSHSLYISSQVPIKLSGFTPVHDIRIVNNQLRIYPPFNEADREIGQVIALQDRQHYFVYGLSHSGELMKYSLAEASWSYVSDVCSAAFGMLKAQGTNQVMVLCDNRNALLNPTDKVIQWQVTAPAFTVTKTSALAVSTVNNQIRVALGGAAIAVVDRPVFSTRPVALNYQWHMHWAKTAQVQLPSINPNLGRPLTTKIVLHPQNGKLSVVDGELGTIQYEPGLPSLDVEFAQYVVSSDQLESTPAEIRIVKTNQTPTTVESSIVVSSGVSFNGKVQATDGDDDALTWHVESFPTKGTLTLNSSNGEYIFTSFPSAVGEDSFSVLVSDGVSSSAPALMKVTINAPVPPRKSDGGSAPLTGVLIFALLILLTKIKRVKSLEV